MFNTQFSIGKRFVGNVMDENNWGISESGGDELVVHC